MAARWFKRDDPDRSGGQPLDPVDERLRRQAERAGRTLGEEQEQILREVLPNVRRTVAEAGLTMGQYLELDPVSYHRLLVSGAGSRPLFGRRGGLLDHESYLRMRRWVEAAAARAGVSPEQWATTALAQGPVSPWRRLVGSRPDAEPRDPDGAASSDQTPFGDPSDPRDGSRSGARSSSGDPLIDRLERLTALRDSGALTEDEFQAQKRRLLDDD